MDYRITKYSQCREYLELPRSRSYTMAFSTCQSSATGAAMQEQQCRSSNAGAARQEQRCRSSDAGATCDVQDGLRGWGAGSQQVTLPRGAGLAVSIGRPPCPPPLLSRPGTLFPHSLGYRPLGMSSPWLIHVKLAEPASRVSWIRIILSN